METLPPELHLLVSCARTRTSAATDLLIRRYLEGSIDWKLFAELATRHGLACLAGETLLRVASDRVPEDILEALQASTDQLRRRNNDLLHELGQILELLRSEGIEAIPFSGPILGIRAYSDVGLRPFGHVDFLLRDADMAGAISILHNRGYASGTRLTDVQSELIRRLEGRERLFRKAINANFWVHTRFTPLSWPVDIDYSALWQRATRSVLNGREFLVLSPEDELINSALNRGRPGWRNLKPLCDVAALLRSNPLFDWPAMMELARKQRCRRRVMAALRLASTYFGATVPEWLAAAADDDPVVRKLDRRITASWSADEPAGPPKPRNSSIGTWWLHDGASGRIRYVASNALLPKPHHVASVSLPQSFVFAYAGVKLAYDIGGLMRTPYRGLRSRLAELRDRVSASNFGLAMMPASAATRQRIRAHLEARDEAARQVAANPRDPAAWTRLGNALLGLRRFKEAIACYDKGLAVGPDVLNLWKWRADAVRALKQRRSTSIEEEPASVSKDAEGWVRRAGFLLAMQRYGEAAVASDRVLELNPNHVIAARIGIRARLSSCDWRQRDADKRMITEHVNASKNIITPFNHRTISDSEAENLRVARLWARGLPRPRPLFNGESYGHDKIRLAYVSGEFHDHPMTIAMAGVYEHHDKARFELTAISLGPADDSKMRRRIEASFDRFVPAQAMTDLEIARLMRELEIDIAVDLNGYAGSGRTGILAYRAAPIQVNFLAYCGTMAVPFMDYIVADPILIPEENEPYYAERVVRLPHTYMPNDRLRPLAQGTPSRTEVGLPESGFVFTCHNGEHKFSPEIFEIWMRLLQGVPASVLWLKAPHASAIGNLRREARAHGVSPDRIIFASRVPDPADHLARLRLADLFLDTLPYNAHGTACDALWAGLPVLTCLGKTFAGRVGASLLHAVGLPELVTSSLAEYEQAALLLARDPVRLAAVKAKLMRNRDTAPLFDTARFTRDLEFAYTSMHERHEHGIPPAAFAVPDALSSAAA